MLWRQFCEKQLLRDFQLEIDVLRKFALGYRFSVSVIEHLFRNSWRLEPTNLLERPLTLIMVAMIIILLNSFYGTHIFSYFFKKAFNEIWPLKGVLFLMFMVKLWRNSLSRSSFCYGYGSALVSFTNQWPSMNSSELLFKQLFPIWEINWSFKVLNLVNDRLKSKNKKYKTGR